MREKELRIALVCCCGVSLAVYMHGITKEVLKLVRASSALHRNASREKRMAASFFDAADGNDREYDTEAIYFDLLREIGRDIELRVVVDIIAGASAGGINGCLLARAICHDLPIGALRDLWLERADVQVLLAGEARARPWSKWILRPLLWATGRLGLLKLARDAEVRRNPSLFLRSRWFQPPLDGEVMAGLMYDAVVALGAPRDARASLLPSGQSLDLFVTLSHYYGHPELIQLHDPPLIHELEHHHVLRFRYRRATDGGVASDLDLDNAPGLAFAARATSSFPGAFPPARIAEMDALLARRGKTWPRRREFIERSFERHLAAGIDPVTSSFLDGSILNNCPFREAISAIHGRPAYRQVDRRLVYIDPDPAVPSPPSHNPVPSFFSTLRSSLSDLPSSQPVTEELTWVRDFNERARRLRSIIESARPSVSAIVAQMTDIDFDGPIPMPRLRAWREEANARAVRDSGFAYEAYVRLKLASARAFIAETAVRLRGVPAHSPLARVVGAIVDAWASARSLDYAPGVTASPAGTKASSSWVAFLHAFDIGYRERRLQFLIEGQNRLYALIDRGGFRGFDSTLVDRLKRELYRRLASLRAVREVGHFPAALIDLVAEIFPAVPSPHEIRNLAAYAEAFAAHHAARLDELIDGLARAADLDARTEDLDQLLAEMEVPPWHGQVRSEVLINYLGFPFWDVLTFPFMSAYAFGEFDEILVDRISPAEATVVRTFAGIGLKGVGLGHFAAFLSRAYRENDYLLGRLHAIDRLIDIICDSGRFGEESRGEALRLKQRAFTVAIDAEEKHLAHSTELIAALRRHVAAMTTGAR
ncbi:MAG: patatin-like protein [Alphaproteobacteria bacterium]|nr:patatin-like protein [Alphaproteobacteria bacterium]